jgi:hypothetical protein
MKHWSMLLCGLIAASLVWTNLSGAGPIKGIESMHFVLPGNARGESDEPGGQPGEKRITERFAGGERACVIVRGDHKPVEDLIIEVYDENKNLVTKDDGKGDYAVVVWYPPQDGDYTIVLKHAQADYNRCYLVIK